MYCDDAITSIHKQCVSVINKIAENMTIEREFNKRKEEPIGPI
jgi:hypothetical protein